MVGRKRVQGKTKYILWVTFTWGGVMILMMSALDYYDGTLRMDRVPYQIPMYLFGGYIVGLLSWKDNERRYQSSLKSSHYNPDAR